MSNRIVSRPLPNDALEKLRRMSPTANDILSNPGFFNELNEEIAGTYDQDKALEAAKKDPTLKGSIQPVDFSRLEEVPGHTAPENLLGVEPGYMPYESNNEVPMEYNDNDALLKELEELKTKAAEVEARREREAKVKAAAEAKEAKAEVAKPTTLKEEVMKILNNIPGHPTAADIEKLKMRYNNGVEIVAFSENEIFIYRYLLRSEWLNIQKALQAADKADLLKGKDPDQEFKEKVLQYCIVWPKLPVEFFYTSRAGLVDDLYNLISWHSYFLSPEQLMQLSVAL